MILLILQEMEKGCYYLGDFCEIVIYRDLDLLSKMEDGTYDFYFGTGKNKKLIGCLKKRKTSVINTLFFVTKSRISYSFETDSLSLQR